MIIRKKNEKEQRKDFCFCAWTLTMEWGFGPQGSSTIAVDVIGRKPSADGFLGLTTR
jgi:hypothetical protein